MRELTVEMQISVGSYTTEELFIEKLMSIQSGTMLHRLYHNRKQLYPSIYLRVSYSVYTSILNAFEIGNRQIGLEDSCNSPCCGSRATYVSLADNETCRKRMIQNIRAANTRTHAHLAGLVVFDRVFVRGAVLGTIARAIVPGYRERIVKHEAGHFLVAYLLGCPVQGCVLDPFEVRGMASLLAFRSVSSITSSVLCVLQDARDVCVSSYRGTESMIVFVTCCWFHSMTHRSSP